ncbi:J domain-containing protein [Shinella pollutisoli]|uniref:J domain-containing protein n=1 Tax=Shinella pollutisoli TaxID=2250594 RepID=A0ABV7DL40_9HYPH|nr:J domain-containing protein [Shinella pollutisoli]
MTAFPYPLAWPGHIPRSSTRETGNFRTQLTGALNNVRKELQLFSRDSGKTVTDVVISSNVTLGETRPKDPGVAVWFRWDGMQLCIPVDRYASPEANLQAIYHVLDARRTELRHGTLALIRASFAGLSALPPPGPAARNWREVLGFLEDDRPTERDIDVAFRRRAKTAHPDRPEGSQDAMTELTAARAEALEFIKGDTK